LAALQWLQVLSEYILTSGCVLPSSGPLLLVSDIPVPFPGVTPADNANAMPGVTMKMAEDSVWVAGRVGISFLKIITKQGGFQP
jgi:hypothetical protein